MSSSGMIDPQVLQQLQQLQEQQRRMQMAQSLMGNQANPQTANAGLANVGGDLLGAMAMKRMQQQNDPENQVVQQRYGMTPSQAGNVLNPSLLSKVGSLFGLGS